MDNHHSVIEYNVSGRYQIVVALLSLQKHRKRQIRSGDAISHEYLLYTCAPEGLSTLLGIADLAE
jgi:hypothetical protein